MKESRVENPQKGSRDNVQAPRPENKDNLDSRERKERGYRQEDDDTNKSDKQKGNNDR